MHNVPTCWGNVPFRAAKYKLRVHSKVGGAGISDLLSANFEDRNPLNSQCRVPLSRHRKATPHYRYYASSRCSAELIRNTLTCSALKLRIACMLFELQGIFKVQFILYWKLERRVYPGCTIFCVTPMCRARSAQPCCTSSENGLYISLSLWGKFNKHKWNSALRRLEKFVRSPSSF